MLLLLNFRIGRYNCYKLLFCMYDLFFVPGTLSQTLFDTLFGFVYLECFYDEFWNIFDDSVLINVQQFHILLFKKVQQKQTMYHTRRFLIFHTRIMYLFSALFPGQRRIHHSVSTWRRRQHPAERRRHCGPHGKTLPGGDTLPPEAA